MAGPMILLDTNILIFALVPDSPESRQVMKWLEEEVPLVTSTIVWYEFLCGPVRREHIELAWRLLTDVFPFGGEESQVAANLYKQAGRKRGVKVDAMIAATAIANGAVLATRNTGDFQRFPGLELVKW